MTFEGHPFEGKRKKKKTARLSRCTVEKGYLQETFKGTFWRREHSEGVATEKEPREKIGPHGQE